MCWLTTKSRNFNGDIEWEVSDSIFAKICGVFRRPDIDLFDSRVNHMFLFLDPGARVLEA